MKEFFVARTRYSSSMPQPASQTNSTQLQLFAGKLIANTVIHVVAQILRVILSQSLRRKRQESFREANFPESKSEKLREPRMKETSPQEEIVLRSTEKLELMNIQPSKSRLSLKVPNLELTKEQTSPFIPVNEFKKVQGRPQRILPVLPPVVQEILRWSIHPQQVLRGAASVRHLWSLPTIEEETVPSVQITEAKAQSGVTIKEAILPSGQRTENRALLSNQARAELKPLAKVRAEFRRRTLSTLSTIKEVTSSTSLRVDSRQLADEPALNKASYNLKQSKDQDMCQLQATKEEKEKLPCATSKEKEGRKTREIKPVVNENQSTLPFRAKLQRPRKTALHSSVRGSGLNLRQSPLPGIQTAHGALIPVPPSTAKPTVRRTRPTVQATVRLPSIQSKQGPMTPKPPSTLKPTIMRMHPKNHSTLARPLPNIQAKPESTMLKPPSTPKTTVTRRRPNRLLPSIPQFKKQSLLCLSS